MKVSKEIKQKIFALYLNEPVCRHSTILVGSGCSPIDIFATGSITHIAKYHLLLKPIENISVNDAEEIQLISTQWNDANPLDLVDVPEWLHEVMTGNCALTADFVSGEQIIEIVDFLRAKGYALPAYGFTVEELVEAGIFKIKEVTNGN